MGRAEQSLQPVLHHHPQPVHQGPVLQVVMTAVPVIDEAERQGHGHNLAQGSMVRSARGDIDVPGMTPEVHAKL